MEVVNNSHNNNNSNCSHSHLKGRLLGTMCRVTLAPRPSSSSTRLTLAPHHRSCSMLTHSPTHLLQHRGH